MQEFKTTERRRMTNWRQREKLEELEQRLERVEHKQEIQEAFEAYTPMEVYLRNVVRRILEEEKNVPNKRS